MFRDEAEIEVIAGDGGDGRVSMRREKFVPFGGPDGGDGGLGGSVILRADANLNSLLPIGRRYRYQAESGAGGLGSNKAGSSAENLVLPVPVGTQIFDRERGNLLRDLKRHGAEVVIAQGGRGGQGNARFASSTRQTPRHATKGKPGERRKLRLELKLFAEVGLVGLPNAGKSTMLATVTAATPKIADYPFTTLAPQVGIAQLSENETLVIADLPGLIEGASEGIGLGHRFLKHVERCQAILQLVDISESAELAPAEAYRVIDGEVRAFSELLAQKERIVGASKCESAEDEARAAELERAIGRRVWRLSAMQHKGLQEILRECHTRVHAADVLPRTAERTPELGRSRADS